ncbi:hypothetical protein [Kineococcus rhizosphaerae]|uniref:Uncharacterized protein n=1 Tax=Kineococcus rhizosphaerae TaxID=559628 RepID=A0A2T0R064_9ACTN|nr:hypothetical protein [Kineococcus rhizosphaerae]PRY12519.1 hypothetical protein CLV37_11079 [Kineococcus rhizosphaerae]
MSDDADIAAWLSGRLPQDWFETAPAVSVDREEIVVTGRLAVPESTEGGDGTGSGATRRAEAGRVARFREETRPARMRIADEAESLFGRKVAWGAACGQTEELFTNLATPVMTRLRQPQRQVLDTLVDAGVARTRSEALAWCVRLVGQHQRDWIESLREALAGVEEARAAGPA